MNLKVPDGCYVAAVSGGIDSMVLLDILARTKGTRLVVAHFNHGIRSDSLKDEELVIEAANKYGLPYEVGHGKLGPAASEEKARNYRYDFLYSAAKKHTADGIITAHHQDDLIETAFINILRGTGPKGLAAISSNQKVLRPLLGISKKRLMSYAAAHNLKWNEDITNSDTKYLRNYVRLRLMPKLKAKDRRTLVEQLDKIAEAEQKKSLVVATISHNIASEDKINRSAFTFLPFEVGAEIIMEWMRSNGLRDYDRKTVDRLSIVLKTARPGTIYPVKKGLSMRVDVKTARLVKTT